MGRRNRVRVPSYHTARKMDSELYRNRRRPVIDIIRKAKRLLAQRGIDLPRIEVRITDTDAAHRNVLGTALMGRLQIFIAEKSFADSTRLIHVVLHEMLHAVKGIEHDENCTLMASVCYADKWNSESEIYNTFLGYFN